jgi:TusA-related sulfurtransferase
MNTATVIKPHASLDLKGLSCPGPLLGAKRIIDELQTGQVLLLISDCPGTKDDLFSWVKYTDNEIIRTETMPEGGLGFYIRKGKSKHPIPNAVLDMRGISCPGPIVEARRLINGLQPGEVLKLVSNCPGIKSDIAGWISATGLKLRDTIETAPGEYEFFIAKA